MSRRNHDSGETSGQARGRGLVQPWAGPRGAHAALR